MKSFAVVIMGSPLQSNHELLKNALRSAPPTMPVNIYAPEGGGGEEANCMQTRAGRGLRDVSAAARGLLWGKYDNEGRNEVQ